MRGVLADTGPIYAAADIDDNFHSRSRVELKRLEEEGREVFVLYPTVLECYSLIVRRLPLQTAHNWLNDIAAGAAMVSPTPADYQAASVLVKSYTDQPLTLFDTVLAVVGERLELPIWTYDHHFDMLRCRVWRTG